MRLIQLRTFFYIFIFICYSNASFGQNSIDISQLQKAGRINLSSSTLYKTGNDITEIEHLDDTSKEKWYINKDNIYHFGFSRNAYWIKFKLKNSKHKTSNCYLLLSNRGINSIELFKKEKGSIISYGILGDHVPIQNRKYHSNFFIYPLEIPEGDTGTFYLYCAKKNENFNLSLYLYSEQALREREDKSRFYLGVFIGTLFLATIISFFLYLSMKEKLHLWYTIYIFSVINILISYEAYDTLYLFKNIPLYADISRYIASCITLSIMIYVMQLFCKQSSQNSRFFKISNIIKWSIVSIIPLTFLIYTSFPTFEMKKMHYITFILLQFAGIIIIMISTMEKVLQKYKPAIFYLSAVFILLISGVMANLVESGLLIRSIETPNQLQWSFTLEVIIIATGILYRYNLIKKENETLSDELNKIKLETVRNILDTQIKEQQRIAEDLHDVLGSQLSALKIKIAFLLKNEQQNEIDNLIDDISGNTRKIAHNLIPDELNNNSISDIIATYLKQLNNKGTIKFNFIQTGEPVEFSKEIEINIYKILMEIINNIIKHSQAEEATVQFFFKEEELQIFVEDNGVGIEHTFSAGMGIKNIYKRVEHLRGKIVIDSRPGSTSIIITLPITYDTHL